MHSHTLRGSLLAILALLVCVQARGQGTQIGSNSSSRGARLAQYDGAMVAEPDGMAGQGMIVQPGGEAWGCDPYETQGGWSNNMFGVPCGESCQGRGAGFIAGGGVYFIKPMWTNNQAGIVTGPGPSLGRLEINNDHEFAPFAFLGFVGPNGFGVRGRAWYYEYAANDVVFTLPAGNTVASQSPLFAATPLVNTNVSSATPGDVFRVSSNLNLYVYDLEAFQAIDHDQWTWTFSGGVRYAIIRQQYVATITPVAVGGPAAQSVNSLHRFSGWGPTISLEGRRAFGQTGLALYGNARGSLLFGDSTQDVTSTLSVGPAFAHPAVNASAARWSPLSIFEFEIGGEYGYWLGTTARLFARGGLVGQAWLNAGNAANAGLDGLPDDNANMGFTGYRATVGVDY
ncbi:MAG: Lpg1974 family pore-forming outer membrane protein [Pirellulales bacterium]